MTSCLTIAADPYEFELTIRQTALIIIDMQRDFLEPGGFGEALGNKVSLLRTAIAPIASVLHGARNAGMLVIHTREGHRQDLSDLAPAKQRRGNFAVGIGDPGPMGRILVRGESGHDIISELAPAPGEPVIDKPGKGAFFATDLEAILLGRGITKLILCGARQPVSARGLYRAPGLEGGRRAHWLLAGHGPRHLGGMFPRVDGATSCCRTARCHLAHPALYRSGDRRAGFRGNPRAPCPAVILALLPNIANWAQSQIDGALAAAGTSADKIGLDALGANGVVYHGMQLFGGGATLAGLILGAIAAFIIDRKFESAAIYAMIGAVLSFFGFINGTALAFGNSAPVALGYAVLALLCYGFRQTVPIAKPVTLEEEADPAAI